MTTTRPRVRPLADLLRLFVPLGVWFAQFTTLYFAEALMCTPAIARPGALIWIGAAATVAALAALVTFSFFLCRRADSGHTDATFRYDAALWLTLLAALAVIWIAFPLAVLPVCSR